MRNLSNISYWTGWTIATGLACIGLWNKFNSPHREEVNIRASLFNIVHSEDFSEEQKKCAERIIDGMDYRVVQKHNQYLSRNNLLGYASAGVFVAGCIGSALAKRRDN